MRTKKELVAILVDKGMTEQAAEEQVEKDFNLLFLEDCSICRRTMTALEMRYHYHACE